MQKSMKAIMRNVFKKHEVNDEQFPETYEKKWEMAENIAYQVGEALERIAFCCSVLCYAAVAATAALHCRSSFIVDTTTWLRS